jgi:RNA polymerase sigma-70 factor, ECF subfamily
VWLVLEEVTRSADASEAVEQSYRLTGPKLWRSILLFSGSVDVADEALAEAYAQALRRGSAIDDVDAWVWRASFQIARGELKRTRGRPELVEDAPSVEMSSHVLDVVRALRAIPPRQREALVLHHYVDYPIRDVARLMGTTVPAVAMLLERGRRNIRPLLEEQDV